MAKGSRRLAGSAFRITGDRVEVPASGDRRRSLETLNQATVGFFDKLGPRSAGTTATLSHEIKRIVTRSPTTAENLEELEAAPASGGPGFRHDPADSRCRPGRRLRRREVRWLDFIEITASEVTKALGATTGGRRRVRPDRGVRRGVNGTGKTTTCAKLAARCSSGGALLAACDTFRAAAATQQLKLWGNV